MDFCRKKLSFFLCFLSTFIAHSFLFYNCFYINSMDSSYVLKGSEIQVMSGRFIGRLIENFITKLGFHTVIKPINVFIAFLFICLINMLVVEIINIKKKKNIILFSMLFPLAPYIIQTLGFNFVCHFDFFAELLMVYAIYLVIRKNRYVLPIFLIVISIGIYQAYFSFGIAILYLYVIKNVLEKIRIRELIKKGIATLTVLFIGFIIYYIANRMYMNTAEIGDRFKILSENSGYSNVSDIFARVVIAYNHFIGVFVSEYGGLCIFKFVAWVIILFMIIVHVKLFFYYIFNENNIKKTQIKTVNNDGANNNISKTINNDFINRNFVNKNAKGKYVPLLVYIMLLLILPIIVDLNYVLTGETSYRTQTNIFLILMLPIVINDTISLQIDSTSYYSKEIKTYFKSIFVDINNIFLFFRKEIVTCISVFLICMFIFISVAEHYNLFIINKDYERQVMYMVSKIMNHPDYYDGVNLIVSGQWNSTQNIGSASDQKYFHIHEKPEFNCLTIEYALEQHFKLYGSTRVTMMLNEESKALVQDMPSYPDDGCIKRVQGTGLLIKFSN